ncbi:MAG: alpha/beta hydrolase family protein [Candidatus Limivicinus sp.]
MKIKMNAKFWIVVALILCLIGSIGASQIQSCGGKITIKDMSWESPEGYLLSGTLYKPQTASEQYPAPAVVTVEGWYNNKEMQDLYSIELARRGYVVIALDMHGHGNTEATYQADLYNGAVGVDAAVQLIASLPYVDTTRIGVTGHSSGGTAANMAVEIDNSRETPLIAAVLQQAGDWQDDTGGDHSGDYGSRDVGIIASEYDDFYFGTYDENGNMLTNPKQFMETDGAKKFLNFNEDGFEGTAEAGKYYEKDFDGETAYRVIYRPTMIHPLVTYSPKCVSYALDFFDLTLGSPRQLDSGNQIWQWKAVFNGIGLIGFFVFMFSFAIALLDTPTFAVLKAKEEVKPAICKDNAGKLWFWALAVLGAVFSGWSFIFCMNHVYTNTTEFFVQTGPLTIGVWCLMSGGFALVMMLIYYFCYGRKNGFSFKDSGIVISLEQAWKTVVLAIIVIAVSFSLVFCSQYFFKVDYRIYVLAVKTFNADKVIIALKYLIFFLVFYIINSISINCFNFNNIGGKWNIVILALFNALGSIFIVASQYIYFYATGYQLYGLTEGQRIGPIWLFPVMVILFGAAITARILYKKTKNPYLAGLINSMFVVLISVSNTFTVLGGAQMVCTTF